MVLDPVFDRFVHGSPLSVMVRGTLEHALPTSDLDALFEKAASRGVAMEINADPHRLDLDWRVLRRAREAGVTISIGADAHNVSSIGNVEYGVGMARKGWLGPNDILNARPLEEFLAFAAKRRTA